MALETRGMTSNLEVEGTRRAEVSQETGGLSLERKLTQPGEEPLEVVEYVLRDSQITNSDGSVVFELKGAQVRCLEVFPQGRYRRRQEQGRAERSPARLSRGAFAPRGG